MIPDTNILLTAFAAVFLIGCVLVVMGVRGRRIGTKPYCRRCGYDLTGRPERCPECGTQASGNNVVIGVRRRRWRVIGLAAPLVLISSLALGTVLYTRAKRFNWYPHLPQFVLVLQAEQDDAKALWELEARISDGRARPAGLSGLAAKALEKQPAEWHPGLPSPWTDFLAAMDVSGFLKDEQREQLREVMVHVGGTSQEVVLQGEPLKWFYHCSIVGRSGLSGDWAIKDAYLRLDDRVDVGPDTQPQSFAAMMGAASGSVSIDTTGVPAGHHPVEIGYTRVFRNPSFTRRFKGEIMIQIVAPAPPPSSRPLP